MNLHQLRTLGEAAEHAKSEAVEFIESLEDSKVEPRKLCLQGAPLLAKSISDINHAANLSDATKATREALRLAKKLNTIAKKLKPEAVSATDWRRFTTAWWTNCLSLGRGTYDHSTNTLATGLNARCDTKDLSLGRYAVCIHTLEARLNKLKDLKEKEATKPK